MDEAKVSLTCARGGNPQLTIRGDDLDEVLATLLEVRSLAESDALFAGFFAISQSGASAPTGTESSGSGATYVPNTGGTMSDPATDKQKAFMARLGLSFTSEITKGQAKAMIDEKLGKA